MKSTCGWCANAFCIQSKTGFSEFIRNFPEAKPEKDSAGKLRWMIATDAKNLDTWTTFEADGSPDDGEELMLEQIAAAQKGFHESER